MNTLVENKLNDIRELCRLYGVRRMYVFGSAAKGGFTEKSDVDILYEFDSNVGVLDYSDHFFSLLYALERLFGRKVDMVDQTSLTNPYFIREVEQTKQLIYIS